MPPYAVRDGQSFGRLIKLLSALWLAGAALRMTILAMPPVIPQVHSELHMSETQVGLLIGLPLALFAIAAVPGSALIARIGAKRAVLVGMIIAGIASGARGAAINIATMYAAAIALGFGVAIMQPAMPTLAREWLPQRIGLGTIAYTSGMLIGATCSSVLTIPIILPLIRNSWRLDLLLWAVLAVLIVPVFFAISPSDRDQGAEMSPGSSRWWPDWKNPLIWLLGLTLGGNNSSFFSTNAFIGDYLTSQGRGDLLGTALGWLNGAQIVAPFLLLLMAKQVERRAWPFLLFGPMLLASFFGLMALSDTFWINVCAAIVGFTTAMTFTPTLALPALLSGPGHVPRTAAGMFTISYTMAIIVPTVCGALWDVTGRPWTAFVPLCLCAVTLTVLGVAVTRYRPIADEAPGR
jgi:MFS transporter, CP family, cyanate transporter